MNTVDNVDNFVSSLVGRRLSLDKSNDIASVFKEALDQIMCIPGDWHAGLSILQSIMKIIWDGFLRPIGINCLGWKRIQKDARSCYFQDSRLVMFVYEQLRLPY